MNALREGFVLLVMGMGTVLLFLSLMVVVMQSTSNALRKHAHLFPEQEVAKPKRPTAPKSDDLEQIAVAIAAAKARSARMS